MKKEFTQLEIRWKTKSNYYDIDTGEELNKIEVIKNYKIIIKNKHTHVYKSTGTITYTNGCKRTNQLKLFE